MNDVKLQKTIICKNGTISKSKTPWIVAHEFSRKGTIERVEIIPTIANFAKNNQIDTGSIKQCLAKKRKVVSNTTSYRKYSFSYINIMYAGFDAFEITTSKFADFSCFYNNDNKTININNKSFSILSKLSNSNYIKLILRYEDKFQLFIKITKTHKYMYIKVLSHQFYINEHWYEDLLKMLEIFQVNINDVILSRFDFAVDLKFDFDFLSWFCSSETFISSYEDTPGANIRSYEYDNGTNNLSIEIEKGVKISIYDKIRKSNRDGGNNQKLFFSRYNVKNYKEYQKNTMQIVRFETQIRRRKFPFKIKLEKDINYLLYKKIVFNYHQNRLQALYLDLKTYEFSLKLNDSVISRLLRDALYTDYEIPLQNTDNIINYDIENKIKMGLSRIVGNIASYTAAKTIAGNRAYNIDEILNEIKTEIQNEYFQQKVNENIEKLRDISIDKI